MDTLANCQVISSTKSNSRRGPNDAAEDGDGGARGYGGPSDDEGAVLVSTGEADAQPLGLVVVAEVVFQECLGKLPHAVLCRRAARPSNDDVVDPCSVVVWGSASWMVGSRGRVRSILLGLQHGMRSTNITEVKNLSQTDEAGPPSGTPRKNFTTPTSWPPMELWIDWPPHS